MNLPNEGGERESLDHPRGRDYAQTALKNQNVSFADIAESGSGSEWASSDGYWSESYYSESEESRPRRKRRRHRDDDSSMRNTGYDKKHNDDNKSYHKSHKSIKSNKTKKSEVQLSAVPDAFEN